MRISSPALARETNWAHLCFARADQSAWASSVAICGCPDDVLWLYDGRGEMGGGKPLELRCARSFISCNLLLLRFPSMSRGAVPRIRCITTEQVTLDSPARFYDRRSEGIASGLSASRAVLQVCPLLSASKPAALFSFVPPSKPTAVSTARLHIRRSIGRFFRRWQRPTLGVVWFSAAR